MDSKHNRGFLLKFVVHSVYVAGALISVIVGAYGVFLIMTPLMVAPGLLLIGLSVGLPIIAICITYLIFVLRLLFLKRLEAARYLASNWVTALLGLFAIAGIAFLVASMLVGI